LGLRIVGAVWAGLLGAERRWESPLFPLKTGWQERTACSWAALSQREAERFPDNLRIDWAPRNQSRNLGEDIMAETLLTVRQVAARLSVGRTTVYELIARGGLKTIKIGRARRIPEWALDQWIAQQMGDQEADARCVTEHGPYTTRISALY
jgi:excisionase family DNA binding protein